MSRRPAKAGAFRRSGAARKTEAICHWCHRPLVGKNGLLVTAPRFSAWPDLPAGTGVAVCGASCKDKPDGATVGKTGGFR